MTTTGNDRDGRVSPRAAVARRVPGRLAKVVVAQGGVSVVVFLVLGVLAPSAGLGVWSLAVIAGGTLLSVLVELSYDLRVRGQRIDHLEEELQILNARVGGLEPLEERTQELEASRLELEDTVAALRADLQAPRSLRSMLGDIAKQSLTMQVVARHRRVDPLRRAYPVTDVSLSSDGSARVEAHTGTPLADLLSEPVVLLAGQDAVAEGVVVEVSGALIAGMFRLDALPDAQRLRLEVGGKPAVDGLSVQLLGLATSPFAQLPDPELERVIELFDATTATLAQLTFGETNPSTQEGAQ